MVSPAEQKGTSGAASVRPAVAPALGTVGLSMGITASVTPFGKGILIFLAFIVF
jgi:Trk-type K+ transport system membrane component